MKNNREWNTGPSTMYLAREQIKGKTRYIIRQSVPSSNHYIHRDLFDLGPDPTQSIHYPGGHGYYFDPEIEEALQDKGVTCHPEDLDRLFFDFLRPEIKRVISGFDRSYRSPPRRARSDSTDPAPPVHLFDKRRFHYLRFGPSAQRYIHRVPDKIFRPLNHKSRDELEHYFTSEERRLVHREKSHYVATVFQLVGIFPPARRSPQDMMDALFVERLCDMNASSEYLAGLPKTDRLYRHLVKYAIMYFDGPMLVQDAGREYIREFINRHRVYRPPARTQAQMEEAEGMFGYPWGELKQMDNAALTRIYRKLALEHHPDHGGDADTFGRLTNYFKALIERKPGSK